MVQQLSRNSVEEVMQSSPIFGSVGADAVSELMRYYKPESWGRGCHLPPGRSHNVFALLINGQLQIETADHAGDRVLAYSLVEPGDGFDLIPLIDDRPHHVEARVLSSCQLAVFPIQEVREWLHRYPQADAQVLHEIATHFRAIETLAAELALCETSTRLARAILRRVKQAETSTVHGLSQQTLSHLIGSVRAVVNRILLEFQRRGIVELGRNRIHINHLHDLVKEADRRSDALQK